MKMSSLVNRRIIVFSADTQLTTNKNCHQFSGLQSTRFYRRSTNAADCSITLDSVTKQPITVEYLVFGSSCHGLPGTLMCRLTAACGPKKQHMIDRAFTLVHMILESGQSLNLTCSLPCNIFLPLTVYKLGLHVIKSV